MVRERGVSKSSGSVLEVEISGVVFQLWQLNAGYVANKNTTSNIINCIITTLTVEELTDLSYN